MNDQSRLVNETQRFFSLHWGVTEKTPEWDFSWEWRDSVPNHLLGGLYAIFSSHELVYVGLGASNGGGIYRDRGISRRLLAHVIKISTTDSSRSYEPHDRWKAIGVDSIATIGFPAGLNYLACALEDYLIGKLNPPENRMKRKNGAES